MNPLHNILLKFTFQVQEKQSVQSMFPSNSDPKKNSYSTFRPFVFLIFLNMAGRDLHALLAALISPPECLGKVGCTEVSHTPLPLLLGGLLGEVEASQLTLHP